MCLFLGLEAQKYPRLGTDPLSRIVSSMTLEEKAAFVVGTGMQIPGIQQDSGKQIHQRVPGAAGQTIEIPRLGIPSIVFADGPAGVRIAPTRPDDSKTYFCTAFPIASLLASTWDRDMVASIGEAMGNEALEYGIDIILGPGMNIHRNPLGGRNYEYFSEDPLVTGEMAASIIKGIQSQGVGTSAKHFAANNAETNRNALNTIVSERPLREIYLKGFNIAVEKSSPWTIMSSYNLINDVYAAENGDLLTNILRNDWGFGGFVMTDWFGGSDPVKMIKAGNDLLMPGTPNQVQAVINGVKDGILSESVLDKNISRILNIVIKSPSFKNYKYTNEPNLKNHAEIARVAGADGMILLKNENHALPLSSTVRKIALFGNSSYNLISGGTGSGDVNEAYTISLVEGLRNAGYTISEGLIKLYDSFLELARIGRPAPTGLMAFLPVEPIEELQVNRDIIKGAAATTEAAIITIGRISGEGKDRSNSKGDFQLSDNESQLIKDVCDAFSNNGKKVIVILNIGGVVETSSWKDLPDAILLAWQAGQESGNAIADVISGKINPSGKLAVTFPVKYEDVPSAKTFPGSELPERKPATDSPVNVFMRVKPSIVYYEDGIYVGYRYFDTFNVEPSFEFGYGLSYSDFEYSNLRLSSPRFSNSITVSVDIKNSGKVAGKEIVQLYVSAPSGKLDKPAEELRGFSKTKQLQPGEKQTLVFTINRNSLSSFDPESSSWIAEGGSYELRIGASSKDIRQRSTITLPRTITVKKESKSLVPADRINELRNK